VELVTTMFPETAVLRHVLVICTGGGLDGPNGRFRSNFRRLVDRHQLSPMPRKAGMSAGTGATATRQDLRTSAATEQDGESAVSRPHSGRSAELACTAGRPGAVVQFLSGPGA